MRPASSPPNAASPRGAEALVNPPRAAGDGQTPQGRPGDITSSSPAPRNCSAGPPDIRRVPATRPSTSFVQGAAGPPAPPRSRPRGQKAPVCEPTPGRRSAGWGLRSARLSLPPPLPHFTQAPAWDPGSRALPSSILIPGRSQVGPSNLAAEKRQRCLPVAKTRLYRGASLRLSPSESERARGAFPSVLWQTKAGDKGERTPGRLRHSRTTLSQTFLFNCANRRKMNLGGVDLDPHRRCSRP